MSCLCVCAAGAAATSARAAGAAVGSARSTAHDDPTAAWTVYHGNPLGTGVDPSGVSFSPANSAWRSPELDGQIYGEPLEATGRVFVATENDTIYALAANTGAILWSTNVGTPVPSNPGQDLPCGNIQPVEGITGTPVIDTDRGEIFAVADELVGGAPEHFLVGLDLYTGAARMSPVPVDPPDPADNPTANLLQRTGLNLDDGNVVFGFGGNSGDCQPYHGWVVSVPEGGGTPAYYDTTGSVANGVQGAVWMGGAAPEVDAAGNIWAATGNGTESTPYDGSDSVIELSSALALEALFAPADWQFDNQNDNDLGSAPPALLSNGTVLQVGKSQTGFLLNQASLGGIGGEIASGPICDDNDADGGNAVEGTVVYVGCFDGVQAIQTNPSVGVLWTAAGGNPGPPIIAGGLVWSIGSGALDGIDPATGLTVEHLPIGGEANDFPTPSVGDGLLLAPTTDQVVAFSGSAGLPAPPLPPSADPPNSSYWLAASDGGVFTFGNAAFHGSAGGLPLHKPVVGIAPTASENGYWLVSSDGGIFTYGDAGFYGSQGGKPLNAPIVGMAGTPDGGGYWLVAADGGVFSFGDAKFEGSMGGKPLHKPIVGMASTSDGLGYWLVASDGGIFNFGDAGFYGSAGGTPLNKPVVGIAGTDDDHGYWIAASDGGVFNYGDANFSGSEGGVALNKPVVGVGSAS